MGIFKKKRKSAGSAPVIATALPKPLYVGDFLSSQRVLFFDQGASKEDVLKKLVQCLPYENPDAALNAILEREKIGSTVIIPGLAIPHGRLVDLPDILACIGLCPSGIEDPVTKETTRLFLLFLGPANYMKRNLDFLASLSALFQNEGLIETLLQCPTPAAVLEKIKEAEKS